VPYTATGAQRSIGHTNPGLPVPHAATRAQRRAAGERVTTAWHVGRMNSTNRLLETAQSQGGVVLRSQAVDAGFSSSGIARRLSSGEWKRVARGGYRLLKSSGRLDLVRAAVAVLPGSIISHHSAAAIHGMPRVPRNIVSVAVPSKTTHVFPGVDIHRYDDLDDDHVATVRGLPLTSPDRTVVDLSPLVSPRHLAVIVDEAVAENLCTIEALDSVLKSIARKGKPGVASLRAVIEERSGDQPTGTVLERHGTKLLVDSGIEGFVQEYPIPWATNRRFDVAFPSERVAIEWDSRRWHMQVEAMRQDRERDRMAVQCGWRILRFTWADVHDAPDTVITTVRGVLAA